MSKRPTAKQEQIYHNNLVALTRRQLFVHGDTEEEHREGLHMLLAQHAALRDGLDWGDDLSGFIEEHAVEIKPLACSIIERAKKLERAS